MLAGVAVLITATISRARRVAGDGAWADVATAEISVAATIVRYRFMTVLR
jgi:hypothetical protein